MARWRRATLWCLEPVKVLEGGSVAGAGEEADVDLEVVAEGEGDFVLAAGVELVDEGEGGDVARRRRRRRRVRRRGRWRGGRGRRRSRVRGGGSRRGDLVDAGELKDEGGDAGGVVLGVVDAEAGGVAAVVFDAFEELGDELFAHAGKALVS